MSVPEKPKKPKKKVLSLPLFFRDPQEAFDFAVEYDNPKSTKRARTEADVEDEPVQWAMINQKMQNPTKHKTWLPGVIKSTTPTGYTVVFDYKLDDYYHQPYDFVDVKLASIAPVIDDEHPFDASLVGKNVYAVYVSKNGKTFWREATILGVGRKDDEYQVKYFSHRETTAKFLHRLKVMVLDCQ
jgi:hypothetical protein